MPPAFIVFFNRVLSMTMNRCSSWRSLRSARAALARTGRIALVAAMAGAFLANAQTTTAQGNSKLDATPSELKKIDVKQGTGSEATSGKAVVVHYTGWLYDTSKPDSHGAKFDS
jgi:FKBP-type peptidyl-prolyl cis-trans isomerase